MHDQTQKDKKKHFLELLNRYFEVPFYKKLLSNERIDEEGKQIIAEYAGVEWKNLNAKLINSNCQGIFFLSDEAFRYYLPGFMKLCLTEKGVNELIGVILSSLTPPKDHSSTDNFFVSMSKFSNEQKSIILLFLEIVRDERKANFPAYNLNKIINQYWSGFKKYQTSL